MLNIRIWVITDTHFGHEDLTKDNLRPQGFSEKILNNIGRILMPSDILIHLGDVSFNDDDLWNERLSYIDCKRWLIRGNHDKRSLSWYLKHGWHWVGDSMSLNAFGKNILLSHTPMEIQGYDLNIHGHFHDFGIEKVKEVEPHLYHILTPKHKLVSLEQLHYQPIKLQRLVED